MHTMANLRPRDDVSGQFKPGPQTWYDKWAGGILRIDVWDERDRLHIDAIHVPTGRTVVEWWDDDARQMFEDGFFLPRGPGRFNELRFEASVARHLDYIGARLPRRKR